MAEAAAIATIGGMALNAYGQYESGKNQARAMRERASAKRKAGLDLLDRAKTNIDRTKRKGIAFKQEQLGQFAKAGVDVGTGSPLSTLEETSKRLMENIIDQRNEANRKAEALFRGADLDTQLSGDIEKATKIQTFGTILGMGGSFAVQAGVFDKGPVNAKNPKT